MGVCGGSSELIECTDFNLCSQAAMDSARLSAAKSSPMMETINMVSA